MFYCGDLDWREFSSMNIYINRDLKTQSQDTHLEIQGKAEMRLENMKKMESNGTPT